MIEIQKFELISKGALVAKFTAKMIKMGGLLIRECVLFESAGKRWITLPSKQYEAEGKKKYYSYLAFEDRAMDDKFKEAIMHAATEYLSKMNPTPIPEIPSQDNGELPF